MRKCQWLFKISIVVWWGLLVACGGQKAEEKAPAQPSPEVQRTASSATTAPTPVRPSPEAPSVTSTSAPPPTSTSLPPTPTPIPLTPTSVPPTSLPTPAAPPPASGMGNVVGRILWNAQPVADTEVKLCQDVSMVGGCKGVEYSTRTDATGVYLLTDVPPGEYGLVVHALGADRWVYVTAGLGISARKYTVAADQVLTVGDQSIYKFDLKLTGPTDKEQVETGQPTLSWEPYSEASYYELYLTSEKAGNVVNNYRVETNEVTLDKSLVDCKYTWSVEAFNAQGEKIAETDGYFDFTVTGQPVSCYIPIIAPLDGVTVSGSGLVLSWEAHPSAATYKILMWNDTDPARPKVLDFVEVRETGYTFSETLAPARYVWSVTAYDATGQQAAGSLVYDFTVSTP
jgi:hypothetical protein